MKVRKIANIVTPLCFLPNGSLVCYRYGDLFIYQNDKIVAKYKLFSSYKERLLSRNNAINRLLRLGIRTAIALDNDNILISVNSTLYEYCFSKHRLSTGYQLPKGTRPLIFTKIKDIDGFSDGIVFGGYLSNSTKKSVNMYHRTTTDNWEVVYTFEQGEINHVHNIVADNYRQCLWVFTGDFDDAAAIWKVTDDFKRVERVLFGSQQYRGCVIFPVEQGLLYATDTPFADNYIYLLDTETLKIKTIREISGSCIYGCEWQSNYVFSSTVEPDGRNQTLKGLLFNRKRGGGIKDNFVHLYCGNIEKGIIEVYKENKDWLPYIFQFGVFKFPYGYNRGKTLYFQPIATKKNDLRLMIFK